MTARARQRRIISLYALIAGCGGEPSGLARAVPMIDAASVGPNPHNVLSAVVTVRVLGADSVAVRFRPADATSMESETARVLVVNDSATIPVLGLFAARRYVLHTVAYGLGGVSVGSALELTTGPLPPDLPTYVASGSDAASGYVVFAAGLYALAIDNTGRIAWYRRFANGAGLAFMAQPTGRYYARLPPLVPTDPAPWVELDALGNIVRTIGCLYGLPTRFHDLIALIDGTYWVMCDETRTIDLSTVGGIAGARVTGTAIQRVSREGTLLFQWSAFDHLAITDGDPRDRAVANVNWTHGNALDLAADGNLIISFRNLGEITKINATTGAVIWRLGGRRNRFAFVGTPATAFLAQHSARVSTPGALVLLDNLGDSAESRAERYALDEANLTARLVRSYGSVPGVVTEIGGSVQDVTGGHTLVSFGTAGRVEEYDDAGRVVWRIEGNAGYVFRAQRIRSLYSPGVGVAR